MRIQKYKFAKKQAKKKTNLNEHTTNLIGKHTMPDDKNMKRSQSCERDKKKKKDT